MSENWKSRGRFLVLLALADGPKHGYEIATHLKDRSAGFFSLSFGALYPILHKLEKEGLVAGTWVERRKTYQLTRAGKAALADERERHDELVGAFERLFGAAGAGTPDKGKV
jgi:PadR family transcriptional regulator PadR